MVPQSTSDLTLSGVAAEIRYLATELGDLGEEGAAARLKDYCQELCDPVTRIAVVGERGTGKSTVINALIGRPLLATGVVPTTTAVSHVKLESQACRTESTEASGTHDNPEEIDRLRAGCQAGTSDGRDRRENRTVVKVSSQLANWNLELIDTPGASRSLDSVQWALKVADMVVFVLSGFQCARASELSIIEECLSRFNVGAWLFVVNFNSDWLQQDEISDLGIRARSRLKAWPSPALPDNVVFVDAREALLSRTVVNQDTADQTGIRGLVDALETLAVVNRDSLLVRGRCSGLQRVMRKIMRGNDESLTSARTRLKEVRAVVSEQLTSLQRDFEKMLNDWAELRSGLENRIDQSPTRLSVALMKRTRGLAMFTAPPHLAQYAFEEWERIKARIVADLNDQLVQSYELVDRKEFQLLSVEVVGPALAEPAAASFDFDWRLGLDSTWIGAVLGSLVGVLIVCWLWLSGFAGSISPSEITSKLEPVELAIAISCSAGLVPLAGGLGGVIQAITAYVRAQHQLVRQYIATIVDGVIPLRETMRQQVALELRTHELELQQSYSETVARLSDSTSALEAEVSKRKVLRTRLGALENALVACRSHNHTSENGLLSSPNSM